MKTKAFLRSLFCALLCVMLVAGLAGCGGKKWEVSFNSNGGTEVAAQRVADGGKVTEPPVPEKPYHIFAGWTYQGEEWSFVGYAVTENITLEAQWTPWFNVDENGVLTVANTNALPAEVVIPAELNGVAVTSIGNFAFYYCSGLTSITIPDSVTSIGENAFFCCSSLASITVASGNTVYHSTGNCLIETASKTLKLGCKNSSIPTDGSVTSIGRSAFGGCSSLTSITIPDGVTSIDDGAFVDCNSLTSVTIENGVTSIGSSAFNRCSSLTSITIPDSVTSIGEFAFSGCSSLTSVTIGNSVTSIGEGAFRDCSRLTSITYQGTKAQWNAVGGWNSGTGTYTIHCTDGDISK